MAGPGHNSGRVTEPGHSWRRFAWAQARKDLLPTLPIEVVRLRVKRAAELGLPYKTYAGVRASTGHDLIGFLFSSNALQVLRAHQAIPQPRRDKLARLVAAQKVALAHGAALQQTLAAQQVLDATHLAPHFATSWSAMRDSMKAIIRTQGQPADRYLLVGDTAFERDWAEAAQTAGYLNAASFFETDQIQT